MPSVDVIAQTFEQTGSDVSWTTPGTPACSDDWIVLDMGKDDVSNTATIRQGQAPALPTNAVIKGLEIIFQWSNGQTAMNYEANQAWLVLGETQLGRPMEDFDLPYDNQFPTWTFGGCALVGGRECFDDHWNAISRAQAVDVNFGLRLKLTAGSDNTSYERRIQCVTFRWHYEEVESVVNSLYVGDKVVTELNVGGQNIAEVWAPDGVGGHVQIFNNPSAAQLAAMRPDPIKGFTSYSPLSSEAMMDVPLPDYAPGDVCVLLHHCTNDTDLTIPAGWSMENEYTWNAGYSYDHSMRVLTRTMDGTEGSTVSIGRSSGSSSQSAVCFSVVAGYIQGLATGNGSRSTTWGVKTPPTLNYTGGRIWVSWFSSQMNHSAHVVTPGNVCDFGGGTFDSEPGSNNNIRQGTTFVGLIQDANSFSSEGFAAAVWRSGSSYVSQSGVGAIGLK